MENTNFNIREIEEFLLNTGNKFASACWVNDNGVSGEIEYIKVTKWFKKFFPANKAQYLFRLMETKVTQYA